MKFKVGDKVRITDRGIFRYNYRVGDTAIIESIHDDLFVLSMRGGGKQNVLISHADEYIEKVEECTVKFKVGDKVRIVDNTMEEPYKHIFNIGEVVTIDAVDTDDDEQTYHALGAVGFVQWVTEDDIELEECAMKFKVGDRVSIDGLTGTIDAMSDDGYLVAGYWYDEEQLTAAPSKLAEIIGVDDDTPFNIVESDVSPYRYSPYIIRDGKLIDCEGDECGVFSELLNGEAKIVPLDGEWYEGMTLYYVDYCGEVDDIPYRRCDDLCVALMLLGNAFTTEEGAESAAEHINADIIEKLGEC